MVFRAGSFFFFSLSPENYYLTNAMEQRETQARDSAHKLLTHVYKILFFIWLLSLYFFVFGRIYSTRLDLQSYFQEKL